MIGLETGSQLVDLSIPTHAITRCTKRIKTETAKFLVMNMLLLSKSSGLQDLLKMQRRWMIYHGSCDRRLTCWPVFVLLMEKTTSVVWEITLISAMQELHLERHRLLIRRFIYSRSASLQKMQ